MNLPEQTQIILISKSKQLQLYHFPCAKPGNALPLLPWQGWCSGQYGGLGSSHPPPGTDPGRWGEGLNTQRGLPRFSFTHLRKNQAFWRSQCLPGELLSTAEVFFHPPFCSEAARAQAQGGISLGGGATAKLLVTEIEGERKSELRKHFLKSPD